MACNILLIILITSIESSLSRKIFIVFVVVDMRYNKNNDEHTHNNIKQHQKALTPFKATQIRFKSIGKRSCESNGEVDG